MLPSATKSVLREGIPSKAGPCVTDNGNFILDVDFGPIEDPHRLHTFLKSICGVLETGLFVKMAQSAYFGCSNGYIPNVYPFNAIFVFRDVKIWNAGSQNTM